MTIHLLLHAGGSFDGRPADFALAKLLFYECHKCSRPYFGGQRQCGVDGKPRQLIVQYVFCTASETAQSSDPPPNLYHSSHHTPSIDVQSMFLLLIASLQLFYPIVHEANLMCGRCVLQTANWLFSYEGFSQPQSAWCSVVNLATLPLARATCDID